MTKLGNLSPEGSIAIGVIVCLLSSGIQSLGLTLQRKSHMLEETQYFDSPRPPYKRRRWQLGFTLFLVANLVGSTIQLSILPLPVLAALQAAGLVFNSLNATWILGEDFTRWSLGGTLLVSGGALLIAYFGALPEPAHTLNQLLALFARHQFIAWAVVQLFLILLVFAILYLMKRLSPSRGASKKLRLARGMCYGALSGMLSAHSLLMAKSAVELLVRTIADGENQFSHWQSWIILIVLVTIGLSQLYCLHAGLQLCSTSVLYPFVFCVYNVITILDGLIYFNQSSQLGAMESGLIVLGTFILLSGVFCLSWRLATEDVSGTKAAEVIENPLTPGIGVIGTPIGAHDIRRADERQPLLAGSPAGASPESPYIFRPRRSSMQGKGFGDEEARVGMGETSGGQVPDSPAFDRPKLPKQRKRATFADFGTMSTSSHRERSSTNPGSLTIRRPSVLSIYNKTKTRRINPADNRALWGELEEAGSPPGWRAMAKSEIVSAGLPVSREFPPTTKKWRRMSEGASQVLRAGGPDVGFRKAARRVSDAAGSSGKTSIGSGVKHGDSGQAVVEEDEDDEEEEEGDDEEGHDAMASSMPLLQRAETGRTYRVVSADARRRRSSIVEGERASMEARRRWRESAGSVAGAGGRGRGGSVGGGGEADDGDGTSSWLWGWHTIDSSHGRPSDDEDEEMNRRRRIAHDGAGGGGSGGGGRWDWESWKRWVGRKRGGGLGGDGDGGGGGGGVGGGGDGDRNTSREENGSSNNER